MSMSVVSAVTLASEQRDLGLDFSFHTAFRSHMPLQPQQELIHVALPYHVSSCLSSQYLQ